jgi:hypothetical protein
VTFRTAAQGRQIEAHSGFTTGGTKMKKLIKAIVAATILTTPVMAGTATVYDVRACALLNFTTGAVHCSGIERTFSTLEQCKAFNAQSQIPGVDMGCYAREVQVPERVY